jgi:hypothetical protein
MYSNKLFFSTQASLLTILIISGCNDGGQSSGGNTDATPTTGSKITADNAKPITAAAFASVDIVKGLPIRSGAVANAPGNAETNEFNYSEFIINQLSLMQQQGQYVGRSIPSVSENTANKALDCGLHITGDIADVSNLSVGDTASFSFEDCTYDTNLLLDGAIGVTLTQVSGDLVGIPPYGIGMDIVLTDFTADIEGATFTSNGDISMLINENVSSGSTAVMSGTSINVTEDMTSDIILLNLADYTVEVSNDNSGDYSVSLQGTIELEIPFISGGASFTTTTPFTGNSVNGSGDPTAGEMHLTDGDSQAWVIAQADGVNIQIDIDMNGDEVVDLTLMTTWSELQDFF